MKRLNLCTPVRNSLMNAGVSTVQVANAVNAALGQLNKIDSSSKLGDGRVTKTAYKVSETVSNKYEGGRGEMPLEFDAWHCAIAKANKIHEFESVDIPAYFAEWLAKMKSPAPAPVSA